MQIEPIGGFLIGIAGIVSGLILGNRKGKREEHSESFIELEKLKNTYKDMFEEVKKQVDKLIPEVQILQRQQVENTKKIMTLEASERSCQDKVEYVVRQNNVLFDMLKRFHEDSDRKNDAAEGLTG